MLPAPAGDPLIALIRPTISGFLMAPEPIKTTLTMGPLEHLQHITSAHQQRLAELRKRKAQIQQRLSAKQPLPLGGVWLLPQLGLNDVERQHWPPEQSLLQGLVVLHPQVSLEPNKLDRHGSHPPKDPLKDPNDCVGTQRALLAATVASSIASF
jgi:hypothetical protein